MKQTQKITKTSVDKTEILCEISQDEFNTLCAETAADVVVSHLDIPAGGKELMHGIAMTALLADFAYEVTKKMFTYTNENPDTKEEQ